MSIGVDRSDEASGEAGGEDAASQDAASLNTGDQDTGGEDTGGEGATPTVPAFKPPQPAPGMRMGLGMPLEQSADFGTATRRLASRLRRERLRVVAVVVLAFVSVTMSVLGPRILGHATDVIVAGLMSPAGIDFGELERTLGLVVALYVASAGLMYLLSYILARVVQRTMQRLRGDGEDKPDRVPLAYVERHQRAHPLSRVTNGSDH